MPNANRLNNRIDEFSNFVGENDLEFQAHILSMRVQVAKLRQLEVLNATLKDIDTKIAYSRM